MSAISHLVAEAVSLGGGNLCASGHDWGEPNGGRACPHSAHPECSQPVFQCTRCGTFDYGDPGGPGFLACVTSCHLASVVPQDAL